MYALTDDKSWLALWQTYFANIQCDTVPLKSEAGRLIYQVYCRECRWLDPSDYPDATVIDQWDQRAISFLSLHRATGGYSSHVRVIFPESGNNRFAFSAYCDQGVEDVVTKKLGKGISNTGEISSALIPVHYRRRKRELKTSMGQICDSPREVEERRRFHLGLGLYIQAISISLMNGLSDVVAVLNPAHARLIKSKLRDINIEKVCSVACQGDSYIYLLHLDRLKLYRKETFEETFVSLARAFHL